MIMARALVVLELVHVDACPLEEVSMLAERLHGVMPGDEITAIPGAVLRIAGFDDAHVPFPAAVVDGGEEAGRLLQEATPFALGKSDQGRWLVEIFHEIEGFPELRP